MTTTIFMWIIVAHIILYWLTSIFGSIMRGMSESDKLDYLRLILAEAEEIKDKVKR